MLFFIFFHLIVGLKKDARERKVFVLSILMESELADFFLHFMCNWKFWIQSCNSENSFTKKTYLIYQSWFELLQVKHFSKNADMCLKFLVFLVVNVQFITIVIGHFLHFNQIHWNSSTSFHFDSRCYLIKRLFSCVNRGHMKHKWED